MIFKPRYILESLKGKTLANFFHLGLNQGINVVVALIATPYLFQTLGEAEYGLVNLALSVVFLLAIAVNYGFNLNGPKEIALLQVGSKEFNSLVVRILIIRIVLCLLLSFFVLVGVKFLNLFQGYGLLLTFSLVILLNEALMPQFLLQGLDKLKWLSLANFFSKLVYLLLIFVVIEKQEDSIWVNFLLGGSGVIVNLILLVFLFRDLGLHLNLPSQSDFKKSLRDNFSFFSSTFASYILINSGLIILTNFVSDEDLGRYAVAQRIAFLLRMLPVFLTQSILQKAARMYQEDRKGYNAFLKRASLNGIGIGVLVGIIFSLGAPYAIRVVSGEYIPMSTSILRVLSFLPFVAMLNVPNMIKILVTDKKKVLSKAIWLTTAVMIVLGSLGSYYLGGMGLAIALLCSEFINFLIHSYLLSKLPKSS